MYEIAHTGSVINLYTDAIYKCYSYVSITILAGLQSKILEIKGHFELEKLTRIEVCFFNQGIIYWNKIHSQG